MRALDAVRATESGAAIEPLIAQLMVEGEVLGTRFINELLALVDRGEADNSALLTAERERLQREVSNLLDLVASGVSNETVAPKIREREAQIAKLDAQLRKPRPAQPNIDALRAALEERARAWRETLRAEPKVARLLLRRLVGPLTLSNPADFSAFVEWEASVTPALLEGLVSIQILASPPGTARMRAVGWEPDGNTFWNHSAQEAPNWARVHACAPSILTIIAADAKRPRASIESALAHGLCAQSTS